MSPTIAILVTPQIAVQLAMNFLVLGSLYTLVTVGLTLIFGIMRIINFAHAQMYVLGAFGLYYLYAVYHINYVVAVFAASIGVALVAIVVERVLIRAMHGDPLRSMIATLGLLLVVNGCVLLLFGSKEKYMSAPLNGAVHVFGGVVQTQKLVAVGVALLLVCCLFAGLKWSKVGRAMRAVAQDLDGARLQGMNVNRIMAAGFALGSGLAATAGALIVPITATVNPGTGDPILAKMFIILILGGLGSVPGAVAGAFVLAFIESVGYTYFGEYAVLTSYLLVLGTLLIRPAGLLGRESSVV